MEIREVDLGDDDQLRQLAGVAHRVHVHERPHATAFNETTWVAGMRTSESSESRLLVAAHEGDRVVGGGASVVFLLDNLDLAWLVVEVDPDHRGTGVGSALLDRLTKQVQVEGRNTIIVELRLPFEQLETHPDRVFAEKRGFAYSNVEVVRHQHLPVTEDRLSGWEARAATRAAAYDVRTFVGGVPEELQESLCTLLGLLGVDAPSGDLELEEELMTPERLAERYTTAAAMDREIFETVAIAPDGTVAAQSTIAVPRTDPDAFQWGTYVHREHRGHSLGLAVEVANLRAVRAAHPHLRRVVTQNAETDEWMIAINEEMGYQPVEASLELVRRL